MWKSKFVECCDPSGTYLERGIKYFVEDEEGSYTVFHKIRILGNWYYGCTFRGVKE